jgi:hypothetical protein
MMSLRVLEFTLVAPSPGSHRRWTRRHACRAEHAGLDESASARAVGAMDAVMVDREGRIRLQIFKPGDYYEPA